MTEIIVAQNTILEVQQCINCGVSFAMPQELNNAFRTNGQTFYCPNGHSMWYGKSEAAKLREQLNNARHSLEYAEADKERIKKQRDEALQQISIKKGQLTKLRKRVQTGTCPHCQRHFEDLQRHMETKHKSLMV